MDEAQAKKALIDKIDKELEEKSIILDNIEEQLRHKRRQFEEDVKREDHKKLKEVQIRKSQLSRIANDLESKSKIITNREAQLKVREAELEKNENKYINLSKFKDDILRQRRQLIEEKREFEKVFKSSQEIVEQAKNTNAEIAQLKSDLDNKEKLIKIKQEKLDRRFYDLEEAKKELERNKADFEALSLQEVK